MRILLGFLLVVFAGINYFSYGQVNVVMNHNDYKRTGWNDKEKVLNTQNVNVNEFGKLFTRSVDDQIFAQPLVLSDFPIAGGVHNIVIVATVNNSVYAFDADDKGKTAPYWKVNLTYNPSGFRPVKNSDMTGACNFLPQGYSDYTGNIGIVGTPAIDTLTNTLYVLARSKSKVSEYYVQYLHAIDITTGLEKTGSPLLIEATYPGTGSGNVNGVISFDPQKQNQRAALLLHQGTVYICWASHCGWGPYHGWMIGYDAATLQQKYVYNTTPNGYGGGIWMGGQGPSVDDDGNILIATGNGVTGQDGNPNDTINRAVSLIKLTPELKVIDFFTPANYEYLNTADRDYGINGPLIIPGTHLSLSGSKDGGLYLVDNNNMGGTRTIQSDVLQRINFGEWGTVNSKCLFGSPVYYKDNTGSEYIYGWAQGAYLKQIPLDRTTMRFDTLNAKIGTTPSASGYMPGSLLSISSDKSSQGTGILWASNVVIGNANHYVVPGILQAFDASDVTKELWNSNWNKDRDSVGMFAKFCPPTIANGKVYLATFSNQLNVYGLLSSDTLSCIGNGTGLLAEYFSNTPSDEDFPQNATLTKVEPTINFDWGMGGPEGISIDSFKVRFTGQVQTLDPGEYKFYVRTDDGVRLWVNGQLLIDKWEDKSAKEDTASITLAGCTQYDIKMEYYENGYSAVCELRWSGPGIPRQLIPMNQLYPADPPEIDTVHCVSDGTGLLAEYFSNTPWKEGFPVVATLTKVEPTVNFNWGMGGPEGISVDSFKVRFTGQVQTLDSGLYKFYVRTDDGVRLWIDDQLVIDRWVDKSASEDTATITLSGCTKYNIKLEYYENGYSAVCELRWSGPGIKKQFIPMSQLYPAEPPAIDTVHCVSDGTGLLAEYFSNTLWKEGFPVVATQTKVEPTVNFNWGMGGPEGISVDSFKVRFTGQIQSMDSGEYKFFVRTDDGVRLWVNNQLLIDRWVNKSASEDSAAIILQGCTRYNIKMEYYENGYSAVCELRWSGPGFSKQFIPMSQLYPADPPQIDTVSCVREGTGLLAEYFSSTSWKEGFPSTATLTKVEPTVNFNWGMGGPEGISVDSFKVRFTGQVQTMDSGEYKFFARTDDGVRLWVDDQLLIDRWVDKSASEDSATITLDGCTKYNIKMEYYENGYSAVCELRWSGPGFTKQFIPSKQLYNSDMGMQNAMGNNASLDSMKLLQMTGSNKINGESLRDAMEGGFFTIFPNPNGIGKINLRLKSDLKQGGKILIYNSLGQQVMSHSLSVISAGSNQYSVPINLSKGVYVIKLITKDAVHSSTLVVL